MKRKTSTKEWKEIREKVFERDNHTCQICNKDNIEAKLIIHHIDEEDTGGTIGGPWNKNNKLENLVTLCHGCHVSVHRELSKPISKRLRLIRNTIYFNAWDEYKDEVNMEDFAKKIFHVSTPSLYRILRNQTNINKKIRDKQLKGRK